MVDDLCNVDPVELVVSDIVLSKEHADTGCRFIFSAMGGSEDVGVRDEGSPAKGDRSSPYTNPTCQQLSSQISPEMYQFLLTKY